MKSQRLSRCLENLQWPLLRWCPCRGKVIFLKTISHLSLASRSLTTLKTQQVSRDRVQSVTHEKALYIPKSYKMLPLRSTGKCGWEWTVRVMHDNGRNRAWCLATGIDVGGCTTQSPWIPCVGSSHWNGSKGLLSWFIDTWAPEVAYSE